MVSWHAGPQGGAPLASLTTAGGGTCSHAPRPHQLLLTLNFAPSRSSSPNARLLITPTSVSA